MKCLEWLVEIATAAWQEQGTCQLVGDVQEESTYRSRISKMNYRNRGGLATTDHVWRE